MTTRLHELPTTTDFDLGAAYMVITGRKPAILHEPGGALTKIKMVNDDATLDVMCDYAAGTLMVNVRRFAACRAWIYRQAKAIKEHRQGGHL